MAGLAHANFRCTDPRPSRANQSITFGAADVGTAAAVAAELANWCTGQLASLTFDVGGEGIASPYPTGSRWTVQAIVSDAMGNVDRIVIRNVKPPTLGNYDNAITALLLGNAYTDVDYTVTALGAPPLLPSSGNPITVVIKVSRITKY